LTVTLASAVEIDGSTGAVLVAEFSGDVDSGDPAIQLVGARVDDQTTRLVNHAIR